MKKAITFLRARADQFEELGVEQFKRSANHTGTGYTEFGNARHWGTKAQFYREAARELEKLK